MPRPYVLGEECPAYAADEGLDPERGREIELVGMKVAMDYEREQGRHTKDVSGENHGFYVRSIVYDEGGALTDIRYIAAKARARSGAIRLSANEWKKARRYGDQFWLHIITQARTNAPELQWIQGPTAVFAMDEDIYGVQYSRGELASGKGNY